jgi:hypothetical protein
MLPALLTSLLACAPVTQRVLVFNIDRGGQTTALIKLDAQGMPHFTAGRELAASSLRTVSGSAKERDIESVLVAQVGR